jgi:hypothetical protein
MHAVSEVRERQKVGPSRRGKIETYRQLLELCGSLVKGEGHQSNTAAERVESNGLAAM